MPGGPAPGLEYGTAGVRLVAYIIDGLILGAISGAIAGVLGLGVLGWFGMDMGRPGNMFGNGFGGGFLGAGFFGLAWFAWIAIVTIVSGLYFVGLWMRNGATVGQMLFNLEVRNAADGTRIGQEQAIRRWAFLTVPVLTSLPALGLLVFIYQVYLLISTSNDPAKQGFHDKQAATVVVRRAS
jgi:uncharacterized RDD family membrane protein YckC